MTSPTTLRTPPPHPVRRLRVAVLGGGQSCEHDVSLASATSVAHALDPSRYEALELTIGRDGIWSAHAQPLGSTPATSLAAAVDLLASYDVVIPAVHGPRGEDGTLAALLDLSGIPYVGCGVRAGALAMDKWTTKLVAAAVGIPVARGALLTLSKPEDLSDLSSALPVVVKPVAAGSSHGVSLVRRPQDLPVALEAAFALDDRVLVEEVVIGQEVDIAVLGHPDGSRSVSSPLEIILPPEGFFDTGAKYDGSATFRLPARITSAQRRELERSALALFDALGCSGVVRVDFFVTADGVVLNEANTMPGLTAQSQVPVMFDHAGLPYPRLLDVLVDSALSASVPAHLALGGSALSGYPQTTGQDS